VDLIKMFINVQGFHSCSLDEFLS